MQSQLEWWILFHHYFVIGTFDHFSSTCFRHRCIIKTILISHTVHHRTLGLISSICFYVYLISLLILAKFLFKNTFLANSLMISYIHTMYFDHIHHPPIFPTNLSPVCLTSPNLLSFVNNSLSVESRAASNRVRAASNHCGEPCCEQSPL